MTATEELLAQALPEEAARISADSLRPLAEGDPVRGRLRSVATRQVVPRRAPWLVDRRGATGGFRPLVALAAAASVLAVIAVVVAARAILTPAPPFADLSTATSPPPYYVSVDPNDRIVVHSTLTGQITAITDEPAWLGGGDFQDAAVAEAASGRVFVVALNDWNTLRTRLYQFSLTSAGKISGLTSLPGHVPGMTGLSAALSPDSSALAIAGIPDRSSSLLESTGPPRLIVVRLSTGSLRAWHGLARSGDRDVIQDPSWQGNERLRFLVTRCAAGRVFGLNAACATGGLTSQEWTVGVPAGPAA